MATIERLGRTRRLFDLRLTVFIFSPQGGIHATNSAYFEPATDNRRQKKGALQYHQSVGGLATGLDSFYQNHECLWIGWPGITSDRISGSEKSAMQNSLHERKCIPVHLSHNDVEKFYNGFSNKTIWPLFHYFPQHTVFQPDLWKAHVHVNELFTAAVLQQVRAGDLIWVHDYQLMLLPSMLRRDIPDASIGFFLHIPFPSLEIFRLLPWRKDVLNGLMGADLIGFHTYDYIRHFLNSVRRLLGCENTFNQISFNNRIVLADVFPMGIDYERFSKVGSLPQVKKEEKSIRSKTGNRKLIIAINRLDYTKGILQRLEAYDLFLDKNASMKEKVTLILIEVPSRTSVDSYRLLKQQVDESIGRINGKHASLGWAPVLNLYRSLPFHTLAALYQTCDIALITPLRDGMNLDKDEQITRIKSMQKRLIRYNVKRWAGDFIGKLDSARQFREKLQARILSARDRKQLIAAAKKAKRCLFLLDYDGTLVSFADKPEKAVPDEHLILTLKKLSARKKNTVAIVSGRERGALQRWFGDFGMILCAEHGVWMKEPRGSWATTEPLVNDWKEKLRPILELFTDRTPGAVLEEKDYSLAFHYRSADPELSSLRVRELMDALIHLVSNLNLNVMEGNKVVEIKNADINKGTAALKLLEKCAWDFVVAIGDDVTDEYLFSSLPKSSYSIKVGVAPSQARFNMESVQEVRELIEELAAIDR